jgi:hypothetical protein
MPRVCGAGSDDSRVDEGERTMEGLNVSFEVQLFLDSCLKIFQSWGAVVHTYIPVLWEILEFKTSLGAT